MPLARLKTFLLGKSASYRLNAYDDAAIAAEIVCYLTAGEMPEGDLPIQKRAASFIANTPDDHKRERLAVQAYTLYHLNGYADLMYSRFIEQLGGFEAPITHTWFGHYESSAIDLWFWIPPLVKKDVAVVAAYAMKEAGIELTLPYGEIMREVVRVQEANIASNHLTCQLLKRNTLSGHPKVDALHHMATAAAHPGIFLTSAWRTQLAAGNWDRLVVWWLQRHYPREIIQAA